MIRLASLLLLALGCCSLSAQQTGYPAVAPAVAPAAVAVPLYGLVHVPSDSADLQELRRMVAELTGEVKALRKEMAALKGVGPLAANAPPAANAGPSALSVMQARCATCHGQDTAADKGGGLELIRGDMIGGGDAATAKQIVEAVRAGTMPKPKTAGTLTAPEKSAIIARYEPLANGAK